MGKVLAIFICSQKGQPMQQIASIKAVPGRGLKGDRYFMGTGAYSRSSRLTVRDVSLISIEALHESNRLFLTNFAPEETRRNILVEGVNLNDLVGKRFRVGQVEMEGVELCDPCERPSRLSGKPGFQQAFENRGGLRAAILNIGIINIKDKIAI